MRHDRLNLRLGTASQRHAVQASCFLVFRLAFVGGWVSRCFQLAWSLKCGSALVGFLGWFGGWVSRCS